MKYEWIKNRRNRILHIWHVLKTEARETSLRGFDMDYEPARNEIHLLLEEFNKIVEARYKDLLPPPKEKRPWQKPATDEDAGED